MSERDGLIARIRHVRRVAAAAEDRPTPPNDRPELDEIRALATRLAHLEQMVEGLQDSVYRQSERHERLLAELEAKVQPGAINAALSKDARERGL